ncbi:MAG: SH3 domain-containing protein [Caulobacterales bacterium]
MMKAGFMAAGLVLGLVLTAPSALAQSGERRVDNQRNSTKNVDVPRCAKSLGTLTLTDGEGRGWTTYNLGAPSTLLKVYVQRSGCFKLVDRGAGMDVAERERQRAAGGDLQRGSNVGGGQVKAADYVLVADVSTANSNAGGSAIGGALGGLVGGRAGAVLGGIRTQRVEAQTVLSLVNVRTSETEAVVEGSASKSDISFGLGGLLGGGALGGGAYENTNAGKAIALSFLDGYRQIVDQLGGLSGNAAAEAPKQSFVVRAGPLELKRSPAASSTTVRTLDAGDIVYPLGAKEGLWWEVEDENGNTGWVSNDKLAPKK